jgi:hypothetical protein
MGGWGKGGAMLKNLEGGGGVGRESVKVYLNFYPYVLF